MGGTCNKMRLRTKQAPAKPDVHLTGAASSPAVVPNATSGSWLSGVDWLVLVIFTAISFATRFYKLTTPNLVLFDEVHFGKFVNSHLTGKFYFDIHPPLVKLLMAALLVLTTDYKGDQPFETIGEPFLPTTPVFIFRFIPALSGSLIVPVVFLISKRLQFSTLVSILCTSMVCFDNLFLGESREILTDSSLILFICLAILSQLSVEQQPLHSKWWKIWTTLTGISLGLAMSTKWTSLSVFGIVGMSTVVDLLTRISWFSHRKYHSLHFRDFFLRLGLLLGIPMVIYVTSFVFYFYTLPRSGPGDPFMPRPFQSTLIGSSITWHGRKPDFWENFWSMNFEMFRANKNVATPHHWQSYWHTWPINKRGIACWNGPVSHREVDGEKVMYQAFVYLLGNPFVWWFSSLCLLASPIVFWADPRRRWEQAPEAGSTLSKIKTRSAVYSPTHFSPTSEFPNRFGNLMLQLYTGWIASILPYALISRACFIYHYMPSLVFAILLTGVLFDVSFNAWSVPHWLRVVIVSNLIVAFTWAFYFFAPLSYGDEMTFNENKARRWFESWN
eukprot:c1175_g1_i1.p1 GENE.c1175_g1_i1~~c1175_g1_i1.p1  ORF type:complete len:557 (+),score=103.73 c1175_g1_i1:1-1671(+)